MYEFTVEKTVDAPVEAMWALVSDFANLDWYDGAVRVEKSGEGIGQRRLIYMPGSDDPVEEELLALDDSERRLEYAVHEGGVNIMQDYRVVATLVDAGEGRSAACWKASFSGVSVEGVEPEMMITVMSDAYDTMLDAMAAACTASAG
jgi:hypothetical protein